MPRMCLRRQGNRDHDMTLTTVPSDARRAMLAFTSRKGMLPLKIVAATIRPAPRNQERQPARVRRASEPDGFSRSDVTTADIFDVLVRGVVPVYFSRLPSRDLPQFHGERRLVAVVGQKKRITGYGLVDQTLDAPRWPISTCLGLGDVGQPFGRGGRASCGFSALLRSRRRAPGCLDRARGVETRSSSGPPQQERGHHESDGRARQRPVDYHQTKTRPDTLPPRHANLTDGRQ